MKFRGFAILCGICISLIGVPLSTAEINLDDFAGVWLFDEGKGKVVGDFTENGNDGEFDGPKWIDGKFGKALEFDGSPKFVTIEHNDLFNFEDDDFTVGCWMNSENKDAYVVIKRNGGAGFWAMSSSIDRDTGFFIFEGGGNHIDDGKTDIVGKGWHHTVAVREKGVISLYVNGKKETERNVGATMDNPAALKFGGWGSENLIGGLDEVFITKKGVALAEEDIQLLMENGWEAALDVSAKGKLATTWAKLKAR
ncbi:MAG: hypothetical protein OXH00_06770 [Candidatus Poribacteria bacterium]|nr:hypothetical protein [Candidatus Poribacteria bacterium]